MAVITSILDFPILSDLFRIFIEKMLHKIRLRNRPYRFFYKKNSKYHHFIKNPKYHQNSQMHRPDFRRNRSVLPGSDKVENKWNAYVRSIEMFFNIHAYTVYNIHTYTLLHRSFLIISDFSDNITSISQ